MNGIIVRRLDSADADIATAIALTLLEEDDFCDQHITGLLQDDRNVLIAALTPDAAPIGFLIAHRFPGLDGRTLVYLYDILVAESHRRQGVASAMVACLRQICLSDGVHRIWVGSGRDNEAACGLWTRLGAERVSDQYVEFNFDLPVSA